MAHQLLELRRIPLSEVPNLQLPTQKIQSDEAVEAWKTTRGYQDYALYLRRLNEAVVGCTLPWENPNTSQAVLKLMSLLDILDSWVTEIPPLKTPQRFGNLAFRTWGKRLEEEADGLLLSLLPTDFAPVIPHVRPYFISSFGSFMRMDYGTGHETSFALFLCCLTLVRFLQPTPEEERDVVLDVFVRYLRLCWRLQDVYMLEPAGSHGVWGLDDSSFLGYIFGSGQLRDQTEIAVSAVLHPPLPPTNLYFMSIMRIHQVKHGPFHEHSSQLYSIAIGVPNWGKVNAGLFKMYEAEVLGKCVVVQHLPLGGILDWDGPSAPTSSIPPLEKSSSAASYHPVQAPWLRSQSGAAGQSNQFTISSTYPTKSTRRSGDPYAPSSYATGTEPNGASYRRR
ncbi:Phosphotyrosyl phosphatase activator [Guyanagaster necrorhizus]|uniref:Serine/threonine-protein phosphatase 2A activator n=1 Tax=Guyanagaster necrorhizus TaxID=856835 RepID=A0A9P7VQB6_9AGAR|nr:Phosphotyrosyl phosphatase activator [Guyanagaster necrorhizus MCA 3950]KAG7444642.1 Phosphotyrosyl phosphatase activator [Guyanagaster necrorhizus MCA 3950]